MIYVLLTISAFGPIINFLLIIFWVRNFKAYRKVKRQPFVSILIAVRNEEKNLPSCIESLVKQQYPKNKFEILIGNDSSEDKTFEVAVELSDKFENVKVINVIDRLGKAKGKANVLAHLARQAKGDDYLITDADIRVNNAWISYMTGYVDKNTGIVNGITTIEDNLMQYYEWAHAFGMLKVVHDLGQPITGIGNNMLITKEAYQSVGGFENIQFSVTEDYEITKEVLKNGYTLNQVVEKGVSATSRPSGSLGGLLQQRKRWMTGAVQLPWFIVLTLFLEGIYYPTVIAAFFYAPITALYIFLIKLLLQSIFIKLVLKKIELKIRGGLLIFEIYSAFITVLSMIYFIWPGKINWKGRKYKRTAA